MRRTGRYLGTAVLLCFCCTAAGCGGDAVTYALAQDTAEETAEGTSAEEEADTEPSAESDSGDEDSTGEEAEEAEQEAEEEDTGPIYVYVCGAVAQSGVYSLPAGSRVYQALEAAGGLTENADTRTLNQADFLQDGEQITVLTQEKAASVDVVQTAVDSGSSSSGTSSGSDSGKVNLNTATAEELQTLPGIGETKAAAILSYRETYGAFASIDELMNISGIKEKTFEQLQDYIEV